MMNDQRCFARQHEGMWALLYAEDGVCITRLDVGCCESEWYQPDGLGVGYDHPDGLVFATEGHARDAATAAGWVYESEE